MLLIFEDIFGPTVLQKRQFKFDDVIYTELLKSLQHFALIVKLCTKVISTQKVVNF